MNVIYNEKDLDDLAAKAVGLGRQAAIRAERIHPGENSKEVAFVLRCLARLSERQAFHKADEGGFEAVLEILDRSIASEFEGIAERFEETGYDEFGPRIEIHKTAIYSARGVELIELQCLFHNFLSCRECVLDHIAANQSILKMISE
tara:strand:+ start:1159 stop:1599 length:441 start_codon:yes stop_codon:yes gene_type:complete